MIRSGTARPLDNEAYATGTNGHDDIHGDFDAMRVVPETAVLTQANPLNYTKNNAYNLPTPVSPENIAPGRSSMLSPVSKISSLTTPAGDTNGRFYPPPKALASSPLPAAKKRQTPSEPLRLSESSKRQRVLPSETAKVLQVRTAASPSRQSENQGPQVPPEPAEVATLNLSRKGRTSGENMDEDSVGVRQSTGQSKGAGLMINTKLVQSTAPLLIKEEPVSGESLVSDYIKTHKEFRRELDNLSMELEAANKRAETAELQVRETQNMVYRANNDGFAKLKALENFHKRERLSHQSQQLEYKSLRTRYDALEQTVREKDQQIGVLKWQLDQSGRHLRW